MNKKIVIIITIVVVILILSLVFSVKLLTTSRDDSDVESVGGQTDDYGCLGPAGYSWDEDIGACTRSWEIEDKDSQRAAGIAIDFFGRASGVTVLEVTANSCLGCFFVKVEEGEERFVVQIEDWEVLEVIEEELFMQGAVGSEKVLSDLGIDILGIQKEELILENMQVKWNLPDEEKIYSGKGLVYGEGMGSRAVFEMHQSLLDEFSDIGFETDQYNGGSDSKEYNEYRTTKEGVVCNLIKFDTDSSSKLELRCADTE